MVSPTDMIKLKKQLNRVKGKRAQAALLKEAVAALQDTKNFLQEKAKKEIDEHKKEKKEGVLKKWFKSKKET